VCVRGKRAPRSISCIIMGLDHRIGHFCPRRIIAEHLFPILFYPPYPFYFILLTQLSHDCNIGRKITTDSANPMLYLLHDTAGYRLFRALRGSVSHM
jgi:hypothetical protein